MAPQPVPGNRSVEGLDPSLGLWGMFVSAFLSSTVLPGNSEVVLAYLLTHSTLSSSSLLLTATLGNSFGAMTSWVLGWLAALGYSVDKITGKSHQRALDMVHRWGAWALLLSWLPVIGDALCLAGGWLKLPLISCIAAIVIGKLARYAAIILLFQ